LADPGVLTRSITRNGAHVTSDALVRRLVAGEVRSIVIKVGASLPLIAPPGRASARPWAVRV